MIWLKWYFEELRAHAILSNQKKQNTHSKLGDAVKWGECNILWHSCHDIVPYIVVSFLFSPELSWAINLQTIALKIYHEFLLLLCNDKRKRNKWLIRLYEIHICIARFFYNRLCLKIYLLVKILVKPNLKLAPSWHYCRYAAKQGGLHTLILFK